MRGCVKAVLLLLLLSTAFDASSQCFWTPRFSGQFRTTALDLAVDGGHVWVATGYGVQLLENGRIVDSLALPGPTSVIASGDNGYAYAGSGSRLMVLRREGTSIRLIRTIPTGGNVNDLAVTSYLFVATSAGIEHYALFDPAAPSRTTAVVATSSPTVMSLAVDRSTLYAADGDASVETFSIALPSLPQSTGSLAALPRAAAVHATPEGFILVSDVFGRNTDVFASGSRIARLAFGTNAFAGSLAGAHFLAGTDRTVRAIELSSPGAITELLEVELAPTDGTDNVIHAIARQGNDVYVAAGDMGVITIDASKLAAPYPLVSYSAGRTTAVQSTGNKSWFSTSEGRISEQTIDANGLALAESRNWAATAGSVVRDHNGNTLLTTSGPVATRWDLGPTPPALTATVTFPDTIRTAVLTDSSIVALLANGSVWTVATGQTTPQKANTPNASLLERAGNAVAIAEVRASEAKTTLHYYATGEFASEPRRFTVDGVATGGIALDSTRAALFTFRGVTVIDLASGAMRVVPDSDRLIPRQIRFSGPDLLVLDVRTLLVYGNATALTREHALPADAIAFDAQPAIASIATADGVAAISYGRELPVAARTYSSSFYSKVAAAGDHLWLQQRDGVDAFALHGTRSPHYAGGIRAGGIVDIAATPGLLFTVSGAGTVTSWSTAGVQLAQASVTDGPDSRPLAIRNGGGGIWLALSSDCGSGVCRQTRTFVLDPRNLAVTSVLPGGVREVDVSGSRVNAIFGMPDELRRYDTSDPLHPLLIASVEAPLSATSLASSPGAVHVAADRIYSYDANTLSPTSQRLGSVTVNEGQQIRIEGGCAAITGRAEMPELYALPAWSTATPIDVPSEVRSMTTLDGRLILLTGHSLEIWSAAPPEPPGRRRAIR
jgi:hypothetical protein